MQLPIVLQVCANGSSTLDAEASVMVDRLLDVAATAQAGVACSARRTELERALYKEKARIEVFSTEAVTLQHKQELLMEQYIAARQRRRSLEAERADFVPFAANELEGAIERVARIRRAPQSVRKLAATAGHHLRQHRRALSAGALGSRCSHSHCSCCDRRAGKRTTVGS